MKRLILISATFALVATLSYGLGYFDVFGLDSLIDETESSRIDLPVDYNGDGRSDVSMIVQGNLIQLYNLDRNGDGNIDAVYQYQLDEANQVTNSRHDNDFDGTQDTWIEYENGLVAKVSYDMNYDGVFEIVEHYENDLLMRKEYFADGMNRIKTAHYENGRLMYSEHDCSLGSNEASILTISYSMLTEDASALSPCVR